MSLRIATVLALFATLVVPATVHADPEPIAWEVISRRPHDDAAFTQGLQLDADGRLFESTGKYGRSSLRSVDADDGAVIELVSLRDDLFGEGLALVEDRLIQLTWQAGVAITWDKATLEVIETMAYDGQGWGLCFDGTSLVMSDGSDRLTFRDPATFEPTGSVTVTREGEPVSRLNELECVGDRVWANIWHSDEIVRIDPVDGQVDGWLDLTGIIEPHPADANFSAVLNGIAYDAASDSYLVTGKLWPELIEIRLVEPATGDTD
jgi:glutamine cyclotransferase